MNVTPALFEAFLKCPTKCWLRFTSEATTGNSYAEWVQNQNESFRAAATERLLVSVPADECEHPTGSSRREEAHYCSTENLKAARWRLALDVPVRSEFRSSRDTGAQTSGSPPPGSDSKAIDQSLLTSAPTRVESCLHAVERIPSEGRGKAAQFIPIRFIWRNKLTKDDKLLLAFDAFALPGARLRSQPR